MVTPSRPAKLSSERPLDLSLSDTKVEQSRTNFKQWKRIPAHVPTRRSNGEFTAGVRQPEEASRFAVPAQIAPQRDPTGRRPRQPEVDPMLCILHSTGRPLCGAAIAHTKRRQ
ncbi:hypothetical protein AN948_01150 [Rhodococcus sp. ADH]|nr:hypothetical protein AN948_01150 [Rhodococcus sp. ADH]RGP44598.1 hypothetical protein AWH04_27960 [Rhodococcus erythropolis]